MPYTPGPFNAEHIYVQWGGKLPGGEGWSCGLRMAKKTAGTVDSGAALLTGVSNAIQTFHQAAGTMISYLAKLSFVKVNCIDVSGHYREAGTNQDIFLDVGGAAGGSSPKYPLQICLAVSLTTGFSRGPAHRGRFYLPMPVVNMEADTRIAAVDAGTVSSSVDGLVTALNGVNADYEVRVFSRKAGVAGNRKVTGNLVGRVLDTQRRRRRNLNEDWQ